MWMLHFIFLKSLWKGNHINIQKGESVILTDYNYLNYQKYPLDFLNDKHIPMDSYKY